MAKKPTKITRRHVMLAEYIAMGRKDGVIQDSSEGAFDSNGVIEAVYNDIIDISEDIARLKKEGVIPTV